MTPQFLHAAIADALYDLRPSSFIARSRNVQLLGMTLFPTREALILIPKFAPSSEIELIRIKRLLGVAFAKIVFRDRAPPASRHQQHVEGWKWSISGPYHGLAS